MLLPHDVKKYQLHFQTKHLLTNEPRALQRIFYQFLSYSLPRENEMGISESNYVIDACHERVESFVRVSHYLSACVFFYRFQRQNRRFCCGDGGSGEVEGD